MDVCEAGTSHTQSHFLFPPVTVLEKYVQTQLNLAHMNDICNSLNLQLDTELEFGVTQEKIDVVEN